MHKIDSEEDFDSFDDIIKDLMESGVPGPDSSPMIFLEQPQSTHLFRYKSETDKGTKTELKGLKDGTIPKIQIQGYDNRSITYQITLLTNDRQPHGFNCLYEAAPRRNTLNNCMTFSEDGKICTIANGSSILNLSRIGIQKQTKPAKSSNNLADQYSKYADCVCLKVDAFIDNTLVGSVISNPIYDSRKSNDLDYLTFRISSKQELLIVLKKKLDKKSFQSIGVNLCCDTDNSLINCVVNERYHGVVIVATIPDDLRLTGTIYFRLSLNDILYDPVECMDNNPFREFNARKRVIASADSQPSFVNQKVARKTSPSARSPSSAGGFSQPDSNTSTTDHLDAYFGTNLQDIQTDGAARRPTMAQVLKPKAEVVAVKTEASSTTPDMDEKDTESEAVAAKKLKAKKQDDFIRRVRNKAINEAYRIPHQIAFGINDKDIIDSILTALPVLLTVPDKEGDTPLNNAILKNKPEGVTRLLEHLYKHSKVHLNKANDHGHTPLILLPHAESMTASLATSLLEHGAELDVKDRFSNTPIHYAVRKNRLDILTVYLDHAVSSGRTELLDCRDSNYQAPLHYAATVGNLEIASCLVTHGADVNVPKKNNSQTPLHLATMAGHLQIVDLLVKTGKCDINAVARDGKSALHLAIESQNTEIEAILREHGGKDLSGDCENIDSDSDWDEDIMNSDDSDVMETEVKTELNTQISHDSADRMGEVDPVAPMSQLRISDDPKSKAYQDYLFENLTKRSPHDIYQLACKHNIGLGTKSSEETPEEYLERFMEYWEGSQYPRISL